MARKQPSKTPDHQRTLAEIAENYDSKVRLLFQLRNYISLVKYDPAVAKRDRSLEFRRFVSQTGFDIWNTLAPYADTRKTKKRLQSVKSETENLQLDLRSQKTASKPPRRSAPILTASRPTKATGSVKSDQKSISNRKRRAADLEEPESLWEISPDLGIPGELEFSDPIQRAPSRRGPKRTRRGQFESNSSSRNSPEPTASALLTSSLITNPWHYVKPQFSGSLTDLLASYRTLTDDNEPVSDEQWNAKITADSVAIKRVMDAKKSGKLAELEANGVGTANPIPKFTNPLPLEPSYHENLLGHAIHWAKQQSNLRKFHQSIIKRNTQSVEQYFRRLAGAEDRERKELDRQIKQIAKRTGQEVMRKWKLAEKVVEQRRQAVLDEEKREKGKEYLNQILDNSAKLIESRIDELKDDENEGDEDEDEDDVENDDEGSEEDDYEDIDDDMGEAGTKETRGDANNTMADAQLTLDELRQKYANLPDISDSGSSGDESGAGESDDDEEAQSDLENEKPSEEALRLYAEISKDQNDDEEEEEEEEVSGSDSGSDSDDSESGSESQSQSQSESASETERPGLASLLSGNFARSESDEDVSESDVDMVDDNASDVQMSDPEPQDTDNTGNTENTITEVVESPATTDQPDSNGFSSNFGAADSLPAFSDTEEHKIEVKDVKTEDTAEHEPERLEVMSHKDQDVTFQTPDHSETEVSASKHKIEPPFLLKGNLREYQRNGLDWLAGLVQSGTNGILADEMGLGKTIQTIALLSWLACEKHIWGPHLIVVPTSVMLNWEMEFKRFAPGFKILTYFGTPQQRKRKRRGWNKEDTWHVCITSYQLVIQDQVVFRGKRWQYMVLDEAHNIKNFRSQRWQALLNFNAQHRLLLTGTPLQNNLVELWSLLYFLMPSTRATQMMPTGFASLDDFQEWFAKPVDQMVEEGEEADDEARATINKLHQVLRPYLLRRLKADVEKQMPGKHEHIIYSRLSKRQRYLYDDFMSRASTQSTLASGNFMSILNCLMQLRKVCNHPNLFEVRPIVTSYTMDRGVYTPFSQAIVPKFDFVLDQYADFCTDLDAKNLVISNIEHDLAIVGQRRYELRATTDMVNDLQVLESEFMDEEVSMNVESVAGWAQYALYQRRKARIDRARNRVRLNELRTSRIPLFGKDAVQLLRVYQPPFMGVLDYNEREREMWPILERYAFVTPAVVTLDYPTTMLGAQISSRIYHGSSELVPLESNPLFHEPQVRLSIAFPDKRLLQYDCGKLQTLAILLRDLISQGHCCLIFTQMTKVLDILEQFLNLHGWRYLRLDGATRIEQRQALTERFNKDDHIPVFILSTRSGGLGINLTGADTVIFYDSDWNPAMDKQCQDRCHRIGQTRDVHIYRLVSEYTIESNILRKAMQKTILDNVVIQEGDFTTDYFTKMSVQDLLSNDAGRSETGPTLAELENGNPTQFEAAMAQAEDRDDQVAANLALTEAQMDQEEFAEVKSGEVKPGEIGKPSESSADLKHPASETDLTPKLHEPKHATPPSSLDSTPQPEEASRAVATNNEEILGADQEIGHIDDWMIKAIERGDLL